MEPNKLVFLIGVFLCTMIPNTINAQDTDGDGVPNNTDLDDDNDGILDVNEGFFSQNIATGVDTFIVTADNGNLSASNVNQPAIDATEAVRGTEGIAYRYRPGDFSCPGVPAWDPNNITFDDGWNQNATAIYVPNFDGFNELYEDPDDGDANTSGNGDPGPPENIDRIFSYDGNDITFSLDVTIPANLASQDFVFTGTVWADDSAFLLINGTSYPIPANSWWANPLPFSITISSTDINSGSNTFSIRLTDDTNNSARAGILLEGTLSTSITLDTDNDNIPNHLDLDSDNDGIPDNVEAQTTAGYTALANDSAGTYVTNNGVNSAYLGGITPIETTPGTPDYLNLDSDGDGIFDLLESGLTPTGTDANNDGAIDSPLANDTDTNGIDDGIGATYADPNGNVNIPSIDLKNTQDVSTSEVDYRDTSIDNTPPTLTINTIAGDDIINAAEDDADVTISGTTDAEDGQVVTVSLNGTDYTATVTGGTWTLDVPAADIQNLDPSETVTANVSDVAGNPATEATRNITYDATAPTLTINTIATDDVINAAEDAADVTISGTTDAEDGQVVTVSLNGTP